LPGSMASTRRGWKSGKTVRICIGLVVRTAFRYVAT
jgi:hypothetical protein